MLPSAWSKWAALGLVLAAAIAVVLLALQNNGGDQERTRRDDAHATGASDPAPIDATRPAEGETVPVEPRPFEAEPDAPADWARLAASASSHGILISKKTADSGRVFGRWLDGDGAPVGRKRVTLHRLGEEGIGNALMNVSTDEKGDYTAWVSPGEWLAKFQDDEYRLSVSANGELRQDHNSPSKNSATLVVSVTGASVQPWNALVTMSLESKGGSRQMMQGRTGKDGRVEFANVRPGKAWITGQLLRKAGGRPIKGTALVAIPESGTVEVLLNEPAGRIAVDVRSDVEATPVSGAMIEFLSLDGSTILGSATTAESGRGQMNGMLPGDGFLRVRHPEFVPLCIPETVRDSSRQIVAHLSRGVRIPVTVKADNGTPMAIILRGRTINEKPQRLWEWRLDKEGKGVMDRLPIENTEIELLAAGCEPVRVQSADLRAAGICEPVFKVTSRAGR